MTPQAPGAAPGQRRRGAGGRPRQAGPAVAGRPPPGEAAGRLPSWLPVRPDLAAAAAYGAPQLDVPVRLNTNENPYPPPRALVRALSQAATDAAATLNRYPDRDAAALREDLAGYLGHGLTVRQVWAANGSNEIIQQVLQAFGGPGRTALGFEPSYAMHPLIAGATATQWLPGTREADFRLDSGHAVRTVRRCQPDVVFLTSPNNPTGTALPLAVVEAVCDAAPGMVVVDEAYAEFARDPASTALALLAHQPRLIVARTMSKAFALAGARIGYLAADPAVIDALMLVRLPYHLSSLTQAVARAALAQRAALLAGVETIRGQRDSLVAWLRGRRLAVADSDANFVLFGEFRDAHAVWEGLLRHGVLIRNAGPAGWLRVSIGTPDEMASFRRALAAVLRGMAGPDGAPLQGSG